MSRNMKLVAIFSMFALFAGCAPQPRMPAHYNFSNPIKRVAILPMKNDTVDVNGPDMVRSKMEAMLKERGYNVKALKESDQILRDQMGINLGGQLDLTTPKKLGEALGVEGVLYGNLMDFDETTTGIYNVKKVRAKFKIVNTMTGDTFWERGLGVKSEVKMSGALGTAATIAANVQDARDKEAPWVILDVRTSNKGFGETMGIELGAKLLTKAIGIHLDRESTELARRVTHDLPWGPGPGVVAATTPPPQRVSVPEVRMPAPSFGYMDYGRKDFSAILISSSVDKTSKESFTGEMPIAKAGDMFRIEMDLAKMARGGREMPPAISKMVNIHNGDKKLTYTIYPGKQRYITHRETEEGYFEENPRVEKTKVGSEVIDRHPTDKFKVRITYKNGQLQEGFIWNARDMGGMTIKSEIETNEFKVTSELRDIILKTPPPHLFEIPQGFTEANGVMELMMDEQK